MSKKCNHKCFECQFDDCIADSKLTVTEAIETMQRDMCYASYGKIAHGKTKSKTMKARNYYHN